MSSLEVSFDNTAGTGRPLSPKEIASLVGQEAMVTVAGDWERPRGRVTVKAAGAWDERRIDLTLEGPDSAVYALRDGSERPVVSIGYTIEEADVRARILEITHVPALAAVPLNAAEPHVPGIPQLSPSQVSALRAWHEGLGDTGCAATYEGVGCCVETILAAQA